MKYDLDLDQLDSNTSHAIVVELVGTDKRVLDVGCSTGYLSRLLSHRGNVVSGIEVDPAAAAMASPQLAEVVVGDVETMDVAGHFPAASFDVIVFADVLEHLRDPIAALRKALPLLTPDGSIVVSLPNIAHGAVRLSLLEGRFEYRPLGLLDDTHLRFFTRSSVDDLLRGAGLVAIDMRRTVADVFATEIPVSPDHFSAAVVDDVRAEPDSDTYQFVFRAVPLSGSGGPDLAKELLARGDELQAMRAHLAAVQTAAEGFAVEPTVGLIGDDGDDALSPFRSLRTAVAERELHRRMRSTSTQHLRAGPGGRPATWRGEPVRHLGAWDRAVADRTAERLDAVVLVDPATTEAFPGICSDLAERGCPTYTVGSDAGLVARVGARHPSTARGASTSGDRGAVTTPDLLVLADRLVIRGSLPLRLEYLAGLQRIDRGELIVAVVGATAPAAALGRVMAELVGDSGAHLVVTSDPTVDIDHARAALVVEAAGVGRLLESPRELDLLALVNGARMVVTDCGAAAALALAYGTPLLAVAGDRDLAETATWLADPDVVAETPSALLTRVGLSTRRAADAGLRRHLVDAVDLAFDELAAALRGAGSRRMAHSAPELVREMAEQLAALRQANAALQARMNVELNALGTRAAALGAPPADARVSRELHQTTARLEEAQEEIRDLRRQLDAIFATRTLRVLSPGRRLYGRLRHLPQ